MPGEIKNSRGRNYQYKTKENKNEKKKKRRLENGKCLLIRPLRRRGVEGEMCGLSLGSLSQHLL
jgi:hypothetical protein